jgi:hypothetical protein
MSPTAGATSTAVSLAVVIPTRNRASLAINAIRSVLDQPCCVVQVLVSDNSSSAEEARQLEHFCLSLGDPRLLYLRPPNSLAMGEHWDWAIQQAMERSDASHFNIHYDRKISKPGHLGLVAEVAASHPGQAITFTLDQVVDGDQPHVLYQTPWTGKVYQVQTARLLQLITHGMVLKIGQAMPIMSNCLIPRQVLEEIREQFGDICNSTGPDSCFLFRYCAVNEHFAYFDRAIGIIYASYRSNGLGYLQGKAGGDFADFVKTWGERPWLDAAPIPGLNLGQNMLYHEYILVQRAVGSDKFPSLDMDSYLQDLASSLVWIEDLETRTALRNVLEEHGLPKETMATTPALPLMTASEAPKIRLPLFTQLSPQRVLASLKFRIVHPVAVFMARQDVVLFLADHFGIKPQHITGFSFRSDEHALRYALTCPRQLDKENPYILDLRGSLADHSEL